VKIIVTYSESDQEAGLSDSRVSDKENLEKVIAKKMYRKVDALAHPPIPLCLV
jgi:hypothetical protein